MQDEIPYWVPFDGTIPRNAVVGGNYKNERIFIGRAGHEGSLTPGMILESQKVLLLPWGCISNRKAINFDILCCEGSGNWSVAKSGNVPLNAFRAGYSENSESLFIGRYKHESSLVCGKIQPSHRVCYIAYETKELNSDQYEVLVV